MRYYGNLGYTLYYRCQDGTRTIDKKEEIAEMSKASDLIRAHNIGKVGHVGDITMLPENVECFKNLRYGNDKEWN